MSAFPFVLKLLYGEFYFSTFVLECQIAKSPVLLDFVQLRWLDGKEFADFAMPIMVT